MLVVVSKISNATDKDGTVGQGVQSGRGGRSGHGGRSGRGFDGAVAVVTGDVGVIGGWVGPGGRIGRGG